jgi:hypothetical protein
VEDLTELTTPPTGGSLSSRMKKRAEQRDSQQTEKFPLPGWDDMLAVELRSLGYTTIRKVISRNERVRNEAQRELYSIADQLLLATVGLYEIVDDEFVALSDDWVMLAKRLPDCPDSVTPRQAILFLIGEERIAFLAEEYGRWARSVRGDLDEEVSRDFPTTA